MSNLRQSLSQIANLVKYAPFSLYKYSSGTVQYYRTNPLQFNVEILSGFSVGIMQVPESIAFAFIAQISPIRGLYSTFFMVLLAAALGGRPGMISGIAGAMVVVVQEMVYEMKALGICEFERLNLIYITIIFCGLFQMIAGLLQIHRLFMLLPQTIAIGFVNGLAIIVFRSQLGAFQVDDQSAQDFNPEPTGCPAPDETAGIPQRWLTLGELQTWLVLILVAVVMAIMFLQPKIKKTIRVGRFIISSKLIPASLTAMLVATFIEHVIYRTAFKVSTKVVGDVAKLSGDLPTFYFPQIDGQRSQTWPLILKYAAILAAVAITENLLTLQLLTVYLKRKLKPKNGLQELMAQGVGCIFSGLFQSIGGNTMIGQSTVNILNGSQNRLAGVFAAFFILLMIAFAGPAIELLPIASLTGILFVVVIHTFEWKFFKYLWKRQANITDYITIILVTVMAVLTNLAYALAAGLVWSVLVFTIQASSSLQITFSDDLHQAPQWTADFLMDQKTDDPTQRRRKVLFCKPSGLLFFGSVRTFVQEVSWQVRQNFERKTQSQQEQSVDDNVEELVDGVVLIDCIELEIFDFSAIDVLKQISKQCQNLGIKLYLINVLEHNQALMRKHTNLKATLLSNDSVELEVQDEDYQDIEHINTVGALEGQDDHPMVDRVDVQPSSDLPMYEQNSSQESV
ncbi:hypothetical protein MP228_005105 [Amoeboaphelidium protococcarum]|nr:hypothetical protein MP228_005105 [Amoeboaphelidium protococcarum]